MTPWEICPDLIVQQVVASEVIEHVKRPDLFVSVLSNLMKIESKEPLLPVSPLSPASLLVLSTINRTAEAYAVAILGAEVVTGVVPKGTHKWDKFITPQELTLIANVAGLKTDMLSGIGLSLKNGGGLLELTDSLRVNYIASFSRRP
jgi:2-polyprenyl-6-hydroxyphenyl methylase/3-demethylubiquinone-9 3-methyltransferase